MIGEPSKRRHLLFLHSDSGNPTSRRNCSKSLDSRIRRHLMVDIGKSRRKPSKDLQFVTLVWPLAEAPKMQPSICRGDHSASRDGSHLQHPTKDLIASDTDTPYTAIYPMPPILYTLSSFEKEWGEDSFSAYGFTLMIVTGQNATGSASSTNTFWFPFAFKKSAFLKQYQQIFTSPDVLIPLYRRSGRQLRSLALERSLVTIQCIESTIASSNASSAMSDTVISAVLALVCYNFTSLDFDQAMIHVKGIGMILTARGGISTLEGNRDLMLMISWVDITAALLYDTRPLFPLSANTASVTVFHRSGLEMLPAPLITVINDGNIRDARLTSVMSGLGDLNALATLLRVELTTKDDAILDNEERMGYFINPVAHHLLDQEPIKPSERMMLCDVVSEALRLGAIIWIMKIKRRCRSYPGTAQAYISTLFKMLSSNLDTGHVWNSSPDLQTIRLWLLILCSVSEPSDQDHATLMRMIASDMKEQRLTSWDEVMSNIRRMPWVDIYEPPCAQLRQRLVENYLQSPASTAPSMHHGGFSYSYRDNGITSR